MHKEQETSRGKWNRNGESKINRWHKQMYLWWMISCNTLSMVYCTVAKALPWGKFGFAVLCFQHKRYGLSTRNPKNLNCLISKQDKKSSKVYGHDYKYSFVGEVMNCGNKFNWTKNKMSEQLVSHLATTQSLICWQVR